MESDEEHVLEAEEGQEGREIASLLGVREQGNQPTTRSVIAHIDLDSFYSAVERERNSDLRGKPLAVVQYNPYGDLRTIKPEEDRKVNDSNGSLIAVSYEARAKGVKRVMRGDEARTACPDLTLIQVPTAHGKADLTIYREAGSKVIDILSRWAVCERASIDEAYCDVTERANALLKDWGADVVEKARGTRLAGMEAEAPVLTKEDLRNGSELQTVDSEEAVRGTAWWWARPLQCWTAEERLLTCGAALVNDMRGAVEAELGYTCSAGIAPNKLLAKLSSGMNKPSAQTLVLPEKMRDLLAPLPISRIKGLGGDLGAKVQADLNVTTVSDLWAVPMTRLEQLYGPSTAQWVWRICRGLDDDIVEDRKLPKSLSCGKTFYSRNNLRSLDEVKKWLFQLSGELTERLQMDARSHSRLPQLLNVSFQSSVAQQGPKPANKNARALNRDPNRWPPSQQVSRSHALHLSAEGVELPGKETQESLTELSFSLVKKWHTQQQSVTRSGSAPLCLTTLFIGCSNFLPITQKSGIRDFFKASSSAPSPTVDKPVDDPTAKSPERPAPASEGGKASRSSPMPFRIKLPPPSTEPAGSSRDPQEGKAGPATSKDPSPKAVEARRPAPPLPHHPSDRSSRSLPLSSLSKRKRGGLDKYLTKAHETEGTQEAIHAGTPQAASPMHKSPSDAASSGMQSASPAAEQGSDSKSSTSASGGSSGHATGATAGGGGHAGVDVRDIDESVLAELPPSIRAEIEAAMRQANGGAVGGMGKKARKKGTLESFFGRKG